MLAGGVNIDYVLWTEDESFSHVSFLIFEDPKE